MDTRIRNKIDWIEVEKFSEKSLEKTIFYFFAFIVAMGLLTFGLKMEYTPITIGGAIALAVLGGLWSYSTWWAVPDTAALEVISKQPWCNLAASELKQRVAKRGALIQKDVTRVVDIQRRYEAEAAYLDDQTMRQGLLHKMGDKQ